MARAEKEDAENARDTEHARQQMAVLHTSIKNILERIYKIMSHSFHVLLMDLIPHARRRRIGVTYLLTSREPGPTT